ncbi:MAG: Methylated-DNA--protein-cysteine methyltransferase [Myxococcota bacterium]|nr:Methylated-DNA--protein-cysteine methyltransferase [Myxococcota bacterium]
MAHMDCHTTLPSPLGLLTLEASTHGLSKVLFPNEKASTSTRFVHAEEHPILQQAARELNAWFRGELQRFEVPLDPRGTEFQSRVWRQLLAIPFGETRSYAWLAREIGNPDAVRAVGAANGRNPIAIIIPCHRVIGSSGELTGYGGGLPIKQWLLEHERRISGLTEPSPSWRQTALTLEG